MIVRVWRGWTKRADAAAYESLPRTEIFPGIEARGIGGYRGVSLLRRAAGGGETEFMTVMRFESLRDVRAFAGADYEAAVVPPRARALLSRCDERAAHYTAVVGPDGRCRGGALGGAGAGRRRSAAPSRPAATPAAGKEVGSRLPGPPRTGRSAFLSRSAKGRERLVCPLLLIGLGRRSWPRRWATMVPKEP